MQRIFTNLPGDKGTYAQNAATDAYFTPENCSFGQVQTVSSVDVLRELAKSRDLGKIPETVCNLHKINKKLNDLVLYNTFEAEISNENLNALTNEILSKVLLHFKDEKSRKLQRTEEVSGNDVPV